MNQLELTDNNYVIWSSDEKIDEESLKEIITAYLGSNEMKKLQFYDKYYDVENARIKAKVFSRTQRDITPNEIVPTAYYKTIVDSMAGFMFSNVQYATDNEDVTEELLKVLRANSTDVKDMSTGVNALAFNKGAEIVYTKGNGEESPEIRFASVDPRQVIFVYNDDLEPELFCGIRITYSTDKEWEYNIDVVYADEWTRYKMKGANLEVVDTKELFFSTCPVIDYRAEVVNNKSPFHQTISYIDALDALLTGNANDIQKLADAILKLSDKIDDDTKKHLDEIKVIEGLGKDAIAEYITKDMSPNFREYVSKLFIKEIHKHSHTVDWFDSENVSGEASGRSLIIRLYDMTMYSERIEKVYIKGLYKRTNLLLETMQKAGRIGDYKDVIINLNRTLPDAFLDLAPVLNTIQFIDDETKLEMLGLDKETIMARLEEQREAHMKLLDEQMRVDEEEEESEDED